MEAMVGKVGMSHSQSVVLELCWLLASPDLGEVDQVHHFVPYYSPSLATCAFVLRSNLMAQASGKDGEYLAQEQSETVS